MVSHPGQSSHKSFLRRELIDRAVVGVAAVGGCAVEITRGVGDHAVVAEARAWSAREAVGHALGPGAVGVGGELEDYAAGTSGAAVTRGAVEIAHAVGDQGADGTAAVGSTFEAVEDSLLPCAVGVRESINRAHIVDAGVISGAVEISGVVEDQATVGQRAVGLIFEGVERDQRPSAIR